MGSVQVWLVVKWSIIIIWTNTKVKYIYRWALFIHTEKLAKSIADIVTGIPVVLINTKPRYEQSHELSLGENIVGLAVNRNTVQ